MTVDQTDSVQKSNDLNLIAHIRRRPGMYIGGNDLCALQEVFRNLLDFFASEGWVGRCNSIIVILRGDNSISVEGHTPVILFEEKIPLIFRRLETSKVSELLSVATSLSRLPMIANALSSRLVAEVYDGSELRRRVYQEGIFQHEILEPSVVDVPRTVTTFWPDPRIFSVTAFDFELLAGSLEQVAYLIPGLAVTLRDDRNPSKPVEVKYYFKDGICSLLQRLPSRHWKDETHIIHAKRDVEVQLADKQPFNIHVDFAFRYGLSFEVSFANGHWASYGGTHVRGLYSAIAEVLNQHLEVKEGQKPLRPFTREEIRRSLIAVVNVVHPDPWFIDCGGRKLGNPEIESAVYKVAKETFEEFAVGHPDVIKDIQCRVRSKDALPHVIDRSYQEDDIDDIE